jgi:hypothetical protein
MSRVVFRVACIDKTPQEFQQQLDDLSGKQAKTSLRLPHLGSHPRNHPD